VLLFLILRNSLRLRRRRWCFVFLRGGCSQFRRCDALTSPQLGPIDRSNEPATHWPGRLYLNDRLAGNVRSLQRAALCAKSAPEIRIIANNAAEAQVLLMIIDVLPLAANPVLVRYWFYAGLHPVPHPAAALHVFAVAALASRRRALHCRSRIPGVAQ
jgi:hypothetical protein